MAEIVEILQRHGAVVVFVVAFLEQIGAPVPAIPVIIVAGAVAASTGAGIVPLLLLAVAGALIADSLWFLLGRRYGYAVLGFLCRISLSPDSCVRKTEAFFERWGLIALLFAKFVPGFSVVAPPLAGAMRRFSPFMVLVFDLLGAVIWSGAALGAGVIFHDAIGHLLEALAALGTWAGILLLALLSLFVLFKWWERRRFYRTLRMARISVGELRERMERNSPLVVLDVRSAGARRANPQRIPGAVEIDPEHPEVMLGQVGKESEIVLYCT